jgi:cell wall-associated NlpC family hydrolase
MASGFSEKLVQRIAGIIRGWRKMNRAKKILLMGGIGAALAAVVLLAVLLPSLTAPRETVAEATPVPTPVYTVAPTASPTPIPTTPPEASVDITLQYGDENENVTILQNRLMDLGYLDIDEATQYFGPATKYAVQLFQRQESLEQDGVAGYETQRLLFSEEAKHYTILTGVTGDDVEALQRQLINLGYLKSGNATGYYGDATTQAIKDFQKANDLSVDGKAGENTLEVIYSPDAIATPEKREAIRTAASIDKMISTAEAQLGDPYVSGAEGPGSFDCSGLVYYCLKAAGSNRGRYNAAGYAKVSDWKTISWSDMKRGDLMFFWSSSKGKIGHVAIYLGNGMIIDASSSNGKVVKRSCTSSWFRTNFRLAKRPW